MESTMTMRVNDVTAIKKAGARLMTVRPSRILIAVVTSSASLPAARVVMLTPGNSISAANALPASSRHRPPSNSRRGHAAGCSARAFIPPFRDAVEPRGSDFRGSDEQTQAVAVLADQQRASIELDNEQGGARREAQRFHHPEPAPRERRPRAGEVSIPDNSQRPDDHDARKSKADPAQ